MANTVVGVFDDYSQAQKAFDQLLGSGFSRDEVQLSPAANSPEARRAVLRDTEQSDNQSDEGWSIGKFFSSLFGTDTRDEHVDIYSEAVRRGSYLLTVDADSDDQRDRAADIMNQYDPVDIDERASLWRTEGWSNYDRSAEPYDDSEIERERTAYAARRSEQGTQGARASMGTQGTEERIPVVEEQLKVGKRAVQSGGVRVFKRTSERPVEESVTLREEHVKVERHAVDQPASEADLAAFKEGEIELRETSEEAVVGKEARVVEEVVVGKEVSERTETVNETLRRTDVEVEQLGAEGGRNMSMDDSDFRNHWQTSYGHTGGKYEDHAPAYLYGRELGNNQQYSGSQWNDIEPEARRDWESRNSGTPWEKTKDAVRYGWERRKQ
jgi:uncharacterized protein (TIGR02271 family)